MEAFDSPLATLVTWISNLLNSIIDLRDSYFFTLSSRLGFKYVLDL